MVELDWAYLAMRVAKQDMDSLQDVFDVAQTYSRKII